MIEAKTKDELARKADRMVAKASKNLKTQLRNLQNAAADEESLEALLLYLRYQAAREKSWRDGDLASRLEQEIREAHSRGGMDAVRLLIGYVVWAYRAKVESQGGGVDSGERTR